MSKNALTALLVLVALGLVPPAASGSTPNHYIVSVKDSVRDPGNVAERHAENRGADIRHVYRSGTKGYAASMTSTEARNVARDPAVAHIELDLPVYPDSMPSLNHKRIFIPDNALLESNGIFNTVNDDEVDVDVAVIDFEIDADGVASSNPAYDFLIKNELNVVSRVDCVNAPDGTCVEDNTDANPAFDHHGSAIATVLAARDNGIGVTGTAPGARIWGLKVFGSAEDPGFISDVVAALNWVTARADEIEVVNMSMGTNGTSSKLKEAVAEAVDAGVIVVAAAGNKSGDIGETQRIPASYEDPITVSGLADLDGVPGGEGETQSCDFEYPGYLEEEDDTLAEFSNYGDEIDIATPVICLFGIADDTLELFGSDDDGIIQGSGTSGATAFTSGAVALRASAHNPDSRQDVEEFHELIFGDGNCSSSPGAGSCDWTDDSPDGVKEPTLDISDEELFDPVLVPPCDDCVDGDVDGDRRADLTTLRADGGVLVHSGKGDGSFDEGTVSFSDGKGGGTLDPATYDGEGHYAIDLADVDGNGRSDLVTLSDDGDLHVFAGRTTEAFDEEAVTSDLDLTPALLGPGGHEPIAVADIDGEGHADLVSYDEEAEAIMVYPGQIDQSFGEGIEARSGVSSALHTGEGDHFLGVADVTGDGYADLVSNTSDGDLRVYPGSEGATFGQPSVSHEGQIDPAEGEGEGYEPGGLGDVTGDGRADLVLMQGKSVRLYPGQANGAFGAAVTSLSGAMPTSTFAPGLKRAEVVGLLDVTGDGHADLTGVEGGRAFIYEGQSSGVFSDTTVSFTGNFETIQHSQLGSSRHELVSEKPSWKRRGCHAKGCGWTTEPITNAGTGGNLLTGVSCTSTSFCVAVGHLDDGKTWAFGRVWNGSSWTTMGGIPPGDNGGIELNAVSCTSTTACVAVGKETESGGEILNFAAHWDGTKWARKSVPSTGTPNERLTGVSCTSTSFCVAVGHMVKEGTTWAFGRVWNGSSWATMGGIPPGDNGGIELNGVSCTSTTACVAVGKETESGGDAMTLAAHWDGIAWSRQATANLSGVSNSLAGVSCVASTCSSVGGYEDGGDTLTLAERSP